MSVAPPHKFLRHWAGLLLLSLSACGASSPTSGQEAGQRESPKISVSTNLVVLPVNVTDDRGGFVAGLKKEHFRVYEDGRLQAISLFVEEDSPVTVGLLVDHSGSMGPKLREVAAAVSTFAAFSNPEDEMFVVNFSDNVIVASFNGRAFTDKPQDLRNAALAMPAGGRTALYDAVAEGLKQVELGRREKKALVIVSDGGDNASRRRYSEVLAAARQAHAVIYSIGLVGSSTEEENPGILDRICKDTGGIAFLLHPGQGVSEVARLIAQDLREQYVIAYTPPKKPAGNPFRKIAVKVDAPEPGRIRVRTRTGYVARFADPPSGE